ncbi:MAG: 6-pyruvoyl-tetrahydropterin synthase-related protein [Patescibacteria group bacterium]
MTGKRYFSVIVLASFLCLTFLVHFRVLKVYFLSDDFGYVLLARDTSVTKSFNLITKEQKLGSGSGLYRPAVDMAFVFAYRVFKENPAGYHATSLVFHALIAWLFYLLISRISRHQTLGFLAGALFIVYPMNLESIAWLSNWTTLISSLFIMLALYLYWEYRTRKKIYLFFIVLLAMLLSLLAKETAIIMPFVLIVLDLVRVKLNGQTAKRVIKNWLSYATSIVLVGLFFAWRFVMLKGRGGYRTSDGESIYGGLTHEEFTGWLTSLKLFLFNYLNNVVFRYHKRLALIYWAVFAVVITLAILYVLNKRKGIGYGWPLFGLGWIYIFALPVINLINGIHKDLSGSRYLYLPSLGFCLILAALILGFVNRPEKIMIYTKGLLIGLFIAGFSFLSYKNQVPWLEASAQVRAVGDKVLASVKDPPKKSEFYFKNLPDNWAGAYSLRNGIENYLLLLYDKSPRYLTAKRVEEFPVQKSGKSMYFFE